MFGTNWNAAILYWFVILAASGFVLAFGWHIVTKKDRLAMRRNNLTEHERARILVLEEEARKVVEVQEYVAVLQTLLREPDPLEGREQYRDGWEAATEAVVERLGGIVGVAPVLPLVERRRGLEGKRFERLDRLNKELGEA